MKINDPCRRRIVVVCKYEFFSSSSSSSSSSSFPCSHRLSLLIDWLYLTFKKQIVDAISYFFDWLFYFFLEDINIIVLISLIKIQIIQWIIS
jgi:hypothetical protein